MMSPRLKYIDFTQTDVFFGQLCISIRVSDPHFFFADPDPGKNLHADPDPDPGGIRGRGLVVKGKMIFFLSFFHVSDDS